MNEKLIIGAVLVLAFCQGCAFLVEPLDTGAHVFWDNTAKGW